jgi:hypothetical protein
VAALRGGAWGGDLEQRGRRQRAGNVHATGAETGEVGAARWSPDTVLGGGVKRFKPFLNSNGSKMFKFI